LTPSLLLLLLEINQFIDSPTLFPFLPSFLVLVRVGSSPHPLVPPLKSGIEMERFTRKLLLLAMQSTEETRRRRKRKRS